MRQLISSALVLLCFAYFAPPALATPIIINGSFELGPSGCCSDVDVPPGSSELVGWTVFGISLVGRGSIDYLNPPWRVSDGSHAIDLDGRDAFHGGVSQEFETEVGRAYLVQFDLSGNPGDGSPGSGGPRLKEVQVAVGDFMQNYGFEVEIGQTISTIAWESIAFTFRATDTRSTISFMSLTAEPNSYGALIDNVRVTKKNQSVPDPGASLLLLGMGLVGLRAWQKRLQ